MATTKPDATLLSALGLDPEHLQRVGEASIPEVAEGLSGPAPDVRSPLADRIRAHPDAPLLEVPGAPAVEVRAWAGERGVYLVTPSAPVTLHGAPIDIDGEGLIAVDARIEPVGIRVDTADGQRLLVLDPSGVAAFAVDRPLPEPLTWDEPDPAMPAEDLVAPHRLDEALLAEVRARWGGSAFDRAAAVGIAARHWRPARRSVEELLSPPEGPSPLERARAWVEGLDEAVRADILALALEEADALSSGLDEVRKAVAAHGQGAASMARRWLRGRDDLAGVVKLLPEPLLQARIGELDAELAAAVDPFLEIDDLVDDDRLSVAIWTEQDEAWTRCLGD